MIDPQAWLSGVVRNLARRSIRDAGRRRRRETEVARSRNLAEDTTARMQTIEQLMAAVGELEEPFRSAVVLRYYEGLPPRTIAARCGVPVATVKSRLKRGLRKLRATLCGDGPDRRERLESALLPILAYAPATARASTLLLGAAAFVLVAGITAVFSLFGSPRVDRETTSAGAGSAPVDRPVPGAPYDPAGVREPLPASVAPALADTQGDRDRSTYGVSLLDLPSGAVLGFDARLSSADPRREYTSWFAPVMADNTVTFSTDVAELRGGPTFWLEIRRQDGYWLGRTAVEAEDRAALPIPIRMTPRGAIAGVVLQPDGTPVDQARVELREVGNAAEPIAVYGATDRDGAFRLQWLPAGTYRVGVSSLRHSATTHQATVLAGSTTEVRPTLHRLPDGVITGHLRFLGTDFRRAAGRAFVVLTSADAAQRTFTCEVIAGAGEAHGFRFSRIPEGDYTASVHTDTLHRWLDHPGKFRPPAAGVEFVCRDHEPSRDLRLIAQEAETETVLDRFDVFVRIDGREHASTTKVCASQRGVVVLRGVPLDARLDWTLRAPGHVPATGTQADFVGDTRVFVPLLPGWGNTLRAKSARGAALSGVEVLLDDAPVGRTDRNGCLRVVRADGAAPQTITFRAPGMRLVGGDVFAEDGRYRDLIWEVTGVLAPSRQPR